MKHDDIELYKTERTLFKTPVWRLFINGMDWGTYKTRKSAIMKLENILSQERK